MSGVNLKARLDETGGAVSAEMMWLDTNSLTQTQLNYRIEVLVP